MVNLKETAMAPEIYVTIQLDSFYQGFLRSYFNCRDEVFSFPRGEDLSYRLVRLLKKPPQEYVPEKRCSCSFDITIPKYDDKDPYSFNYLSEVAERIFIENIIRFYLMIFHESMNKYLKEGFEKKQCFDIFIDQYDLPIDCIDRITKDYQRYVKRKLNQKYRKKTPSKSPVLSGI